MFQGQDQELAFVSKTQCYCKKYLHSSFNTKHTQISKSYVPWQTQ